MQKRIFGLILCITLLVSSTVFAGNNLTFTDLGTNHWAYKSVMQMVDKGILEGYEDGTFKPNASVTREQFAKILVLALNIPLENPSVPTFADVSREDWAYQYVESAKQYLTGYMIDGKLYFKPKNVAVREDMAVAIITAKGMDSQTADLSLLNSYSDKDTISTNLAGYIAIAIKNKVMEGYGDGIFGAQNTLTRAEACELIYKSSLGSNSLGEKVAVKNAEIGTKYKVYNDGNVTFQYPMEFDFVKKSSGGVDYIEGYTYSRANNNGISIQVGYSSQSGATTLNSIFNYWNYFESKYKSVPNQVSLVEESVVSQSVENSTYPTNSMQCDIMGRGIGSAVPHIFIGASKPLSQLTSEEAAYYVKVRDMISRSLKVISTVQPINTSE